MQESTKSIISKVLIFPFLVLLKAYKLFISPWFGMACRFNPSCSDYSKEAIIQHGIVKGIYLSMMRIMRCHPWGGHGEDPVPKKPNNGLNKK